jgi:hypothetical protein
MLQIVILLYKQFFLLSATKAALELKIKRVLQENQLVVGQDSDSDKEQAEESDDKSALESEDESDETQPVVTDNKSRKKTPNTCLNISNTSNVSILTLCHS